MVADCTVASAEYTIRLDLGPFRALRTSTWRHDDALDAFQRRARCTHLLDEHELFSELLSTGRVGVGVERITQGDTRGFGEADELDQLADVLEAEDVEVAVDDSETIGVFDRRSDRLWVWLIRAECGFQHGERVTCATALWGVQRTTQ